MPDFKSEGVLGQTVFVISNPGLKALQIELFTLYLGRFFFPSKIHKSLNRSHNTFFFFFGTEVQSTKIFIKTTLLES